MNEYFENHRKSINNKLDELLPKSSQKVGNLFSAMRYSMLNGGKRIRPLLCIAAADSISSSNEATVVAASAIEMMHVYSLIHDDLPSMDNDDLRRGIASCHIKYNEATAILAGDALQALAFETLSNIKSLSYENHLKGTPGKVFSEVNAKGKIIRETSIEKSIKGNDLYLTLDLNLQNYSQSLLPTPVTYTIRLHSMTPIALKARANGYFRLVGK